MTALEKYYSRLQREIGNNPYAQQANRVNTKLIAPWQAMSSRMQGGLLQQDTPESAKIGMAQQQQQGFTQTMSQNVQQAEESNQARRERLNQEMIMVDKQIEEEKEAEKEAKKLEKQNIKKGVIQTLGTVAGAAVGAFGGPAGMMAGAQVGGGLGQVATGAGVVRGTKANPEELLSGVTNIASGIMASNVSSGNKDMAKGFEKLASPDSPFLTMPATEQGAFISSLRALQALGDSKGVVRAIENLLNRKTVGTPINYNFDMYGANQPAPETM